MSDSKCGATIRRDVTLDVTMLSVYFVQNIYVLRTFPNLPELSALHYINITAIHQN